MELDRARGWLEPDSKDKQWSWRKKEKGPEGPFELFSQWIFGGANQSRTGL